MTNRLTSIHAIKQRVNTIKYEMAQHPMFASLKPISSGKLDWCIKELLDIENRFKRFMPNKMSVIEALDIPTFLEAPSEELAVNYAFIEAAWQRLSSLAAEIQRLDNVFAEFKKSTGLISTAAVSDIELPKSAEINSKKHATLRGRFSGMAEGIKQTITGVGLGAEQKAQKQKERDEKHQAAIEARRQSMSAYAALADRHQSVIANYEEVKTKIAAPDVSEVEIQKAIISGIGQTYTKNQARLDAKIEALTAKCKGQTAHRTTYDKLKGLRSIDVSKITSVEVAMHALLQQVEQERVLAGLLEQYEKDAAVWQAARSVFDKSLKFEQAINGMKDKDGVTALLANLKRYQPSPTFFKELLGKQRLSLLSALSVSSIVDFIENSDALKLEFADLLPKAKFVSAVFSDLNCSDITKHDMLSHHLDDDDVIQATLNLKERKALGQVIPDSIIKHAELINTLCILGVETSAIIPALDKPKIRSEMGRVLTAYENKIIKDPSVVKALLENTAIGKRPMGSELTEASVQTMQALLSLKLPINTAQIIFEAIGKNTQVIEAIRALADIQDNTVLHETMLTVFARDLAADGSTMLSNLCDLKIKNSYLNLLTTVCRQYIPNMASVVGHPFIDSINNLPCEKLQTVGKVLANLHTKIAALEQELAPSMDKSEAKFKHKLNDIKRYACEVILDKDISAIEKERLIEAKVKTTLEPTPAKKVWRAIKDILRALTPSSFKDASAQTFWHTDKTMAEHSAAKNIKEAVSLNDGDKENVANSANSRSIAG